MRETRANWRSCQNASPSEHQTYRRKAENGYFGVVLTTVPSGSISLLGNFDSRTVCNKQTGHSGRRLLGRAGSGQTSPISHPFICPHVLLQPPRSTLDRTRTVSLPAKWRPPRPAMSAHPSAQISTPFPLAYCPLQHLIRYVSIRIVHIPSGAEFPIYYAGTHATHKLLSFLRTRPSRSVFPIGSIGPAGKKISSGHLHLSLQHTALRVPSSRASII
jgi:hypothetical protein